MVGHIIRAIAPRADKSLWLRSLVLPVAAIGMGVWMFAPAPVALDDGSCRQFEGAAGGNDPSARLEFTLCRNGADITGHLTWSGESGESASELHGHLTSEGRLVLADIRPLVDRPNDGWVFCYDDRYDLGWNAEKSTLIGTYRSDGCNDTGEMRLTRTPRSPRTHGCGGH